MEFAGLNYLAILIGAIAGWLVGAVWYGALFAKPWMAANNLTRKTMQAQRRRCHSSSPSWPK